MSYFGYKLSANTDKRHKLVHKIKVSTARENDTLYLGDYQSPVPYFQMLERRILWIAPSQNVRVRRFSGDRATVEEITLPSE